MKTKIQIKIVKDPSECILYPSKKCIGKSCAEVTCTRRRLF